MTSASIPASPSPWTTPHPSPPPTYSPPLSFPPPEDVVPTVTRLHDIYSSPDLAHQTARWSALVARFKALYDRPMTFVARSPGRVNLIGEHIDYSWFPVLPMATVHDVLVAVCVLPENDPSTDGRIILSNVSSSKYPTRVFNTQDFQDPFFEISTTKTDLDWSVYFLAGLKGALMFSKLCSTETSPLPTMRILVDGEIPPRAGLSASSALVCSSLLAILAATTTSSIEKSFLVNSSVISERVLGVNSGGMDQAASVFGVRDHALLVDFRPLVTAKPVRVLDTVPPLCFVLANSLVVAANRAETGPDKYNVRVVEAVLAAEILARKYGVGRLEIRDGFGGTLRGFYDRVCGKEDWTMGDREAEERAVREVVRRVQETFDKDRYSLDEVAEMLGQKTEDMVRKYMTRFPIRAKYLNLRDRSIHVIEESFRVKCFSSLLASSTHHLRTLSTSESRPYFDALGALMNASQASCANLFECSCPEVDELTQIARRYGAAGSRMTGTGWGGCTLSLVRADKVADVINGLKKEYYAVRYPDLSPSQLEQAVFAIRPGNGTVLAKITAV
ncbi:ribosomal protein S5 domain 2-type protein [Lipomyces kononenkoae]|uniref:Ribosomal protein S5 domain 2-type protein n=1 Tax=Lipomyces kononenkoae TaxID=34357 RepID=A0ACC3T1N9_LIPKO